MLITPFPRLTGKKVVRDGRESNDLSEESPPVTLFKLSFMTPPRSQGVACLSPLTQFCFHLYFPAVCVPFSLAFMYKLLLWKEQQKLALCSDCLTQLYLLALWNFWVLPPLERERVGLTPPAVPSLVPVFDTSVCLHVFVHGKELLYIDSLLNTKWIFLLFMGCFFFLFYTVSDTIKYSLGNYLLFKVNFYIKKIDLNEVILLTPCN